MKNNGTVIYPNLESEMVKRGLSKGEVAKVAGIKENTFSRKLNGGTSFKLEEVEKIWKNLFPDTEVFELFRKSKNE